MLKRREYFSVARTVSGYHCAMTQAIAQKLPQTDLKTVFPALSTTQRAVCQTWQGQITHAITTGGAVRVCIQGVGSKAFHPQAQTASGGLTTTNANNTSNLAITLETLHTQDLRGVLAYEPSELVITALAGTPLAELQALLAEQDQYLPFNPPHFGGASVGGMVAAGLAGPARVSTGGVRDYVLGANLINGRGQALCFGGTVMKNVAGYDVSRLLVGSWGALGVITQVSLKVLPQPPARASLRFAWSQERALTQLALWRSQALPINASYWVSDSGQPRLCVRLAGARSAVRAACTEMGGEVLDDAVWFKDWDALREQALPFFTGTANPDCALWRLSLPANTPVLALEQLGLDAPLLEWHGALRWVFAPLAQGEALQQLARAHGGWASVFRLPRIMPTGQIFGGATLATIFGVSDHADLERQVRLAFDPQQVFTAVTGAA